MSLYICWGSWHICIFPMKIIDRYRLSWKFPHKPIQWMMSALWIFTSSMDSWMGLNGYISSYSQSIERSLRICPSSSSIPCWSSSKVMSPGQENGPCYGSIGTVHLFWSPQNINILNTSELVYIYVYIYTCICICICIFTTTHNYRNI